MASSSRLSQLYNRHRAMLHRLDDLESRMASRVSAHRRRAANLLEETPTFRKTHMRIFISHRVEGGEDDDDAEDDEKVEKETSIKADDNDTNNKGETSTTSAAAPPRPGGKDFSALLHSSAHKPLEQQETSTTTTTDPPKALQQLSPPRKGVRKWTLVIEGGLLIPQHDHESAKSTSDRLEKGLPILGWKNDISNTVDDGVENDRGNIKSSTPTNTKADIPIRDQWRGGISERENEKDVEQLHFTHLFDKLEVEFKEIKPFTVEPTDNIAITRSTLPETTTTSSSAAAGTLDSSTTDKVKTLTWERKNTKNSTSDSHAFFVVHNEESEYKPMGGKVFKRIFTTESVAAKIKLYRRQVEGGGNTGNETGNFVPSPKLCNIFFPTFIGKRSVADVKSKEKSGGGGGGGSSSKSKKRKRPGDGELSRTASSANLQNEALSNTTTALNQDDEIAGASSTTPGLDGALFIDDSKDAHIPNTVTMDEALYAIFYYIKTRGLQDVTDLSIINNNEALTDLFGCTRMLFSSVRGLLLEKELLVKVEPGTQPIIFNYEMTLDGAEPLAKKRRAKVASAAPKSEDLELTTRRRIANPDYEDPQPPAASDQLDVVPHQTMLSCDVDIDIPSLFPVQTRDILRRTKYREFEYSSNRNKAIRSIVSTKVDEETSKLVVADAVSGKGYSSYHKQALLAMAKGSHEGGEAQRAAFIDLRTASLMEKLEEKTSLAHGCWDIVNACQGL
ncbi:hypothetical protein ACHAWU_010240 [Discostella pseudostelligera]|uniref:DM2 domain-containing protein n=1 Tax=Discostella pseudostelligera TaxID=259834 RepID=A0ABD3N0I6_9STRA